MSDSSPIKLTITARDEGEAQRMLAAIARVRQGIDVADEILVQPDGAGAPAGHTYRELCDARRRGDLDAHMTAKGITFTAAALAAYRELKAERKRRPRATAPATTERDANVTDLTEHRIRAIDEAFARPKRGR